jgi:hypothetical protein
MLSHIRMVPPLERYVRPYALRKHRTSAQGRLLNRLRLRSLSRYGQTSLVNLGIATTVSSEKCTIRRRRAC